MARTLGRDSEDLDNATSGSETTAKPLDLSVKYLILLSLSFALKRMQK